MGKEQPTDKLQTKAPEYKPAIVLFNADAENTVFFPFEHKGLTYRIGHTFEPLEDKRYFQYVSEIDKATKRIAQTETLETKNFEPQANLWNELVEKRVGFKNDPANWKDKTHIFVKANAVKLFLHVSVIENEPLDAAAEDLLDDSDETFETKLNAVQNGVLIGTQHFWREETKVEMDEFLAIQANAPQRNVLASAVKKSAEERYCELYDAACVDQKGYDGRVPAWHKVEMTKQFFSERLLLLGKSPN